VDVLIIDDANAGFRDSFRRNEWPASVPGVARNGWIILKWARPTFGDADNHLWRACCGAPAEAPRASVIAVFTADDLRLSEMQMSRELSSEDLIVDWHLARTHAPRLQRGSVGRRLPHPGLSADQ
jgi:hypothetical protein